MPFILRMDLKAAAGLALGVLIGVVAGTVYLLLLKTADHIISSKKTSSIRTLIAEFLALPAFCLGSPWIVSIVAPDEKLVYMCSLAAVFSLISLYPASRWIIQLGEDFGKRQNKI
jgi:hypothetical protein